MENQSTKENLNRLKKEFPNVDSRTVVQASRAANRDISTARQSNKNKATKLCATGSASEDQAVETTETEETTETQHKHETVLEFVVGDLFTCDPSASLCHCVSVDLAMGAGIAVQFKKRFGQVKALKSQGAKVGQAAVLSKNTANSTTTSKKAFVYYLVTKPRYFHKPTLASVRASCLWMRDHAVEHGVELIAMPRIACGLDRLRWPDVEEMLVHVFAGTGIKLQVYSLA